MNRELAEVIKLYATTAHATVRNHLADLSRDTVHAVLLDLLTAYFNDKNSSTLREHILVTLSGFTPREGKTGYNGYRQVTIGGARVRQECEAKPKNINTNDANVKKLNGGGSFNDYTFARLARDTDANPTVLVGGFVDGKLIFICRFPFNSPSFTARLEEQLRRRFPGGEDISGQWLRAASFSLKHFENIDELAVDIYVSADELAHYERYITGPLYRLLLDRGVRPHGIRP